MLPEHLLIIGAGPIGLELAQAHRRLGASVTVLEAATPLAKDDVECATIVLEQLVREGIAIRTGVKVARVAHANDKVQVVLEAMARRSQARTCWSPRGANRTPRGSISRRPGSSPNRAASWSTRG